MRIISLAPSNTEILFALGLADQIVGVTNLCDYPKEAFSKKRIGSWTQTVLREIIEAKPDIIFTSYYLPKELLASKVANKVFHVAPKTISQVYKTILYIGKRTQKIQTANQLVNTMKKELSKIKEAKIKLRPKVYMEEFPVPPFVSGNWVPELVEIAGGIPILAIKGKPSFQISQDQLMQYDPHIMIFHWCGYGKRFDKELVLKRLGWEKLKAIKQNHLFSIDDSLLNRPGPRLVEGARKIQKIIHNL